MRRLRFSQHTDILSNERGGGYGAAIGTVIGTAVGAYFGGTYGAAAGGLVGGIVGGAIDAATRPKPEAMRQEGLKDLSVTSAALGQMIPIIYGRFRVSGSIIESTSKVKHEHEVEGSGGGGKGGVLGSGAETPTTFTNTYTVTLAIALCEGPIEKVTRVWSDLNLVYDEAQPLSKIQLLSSTANLKIMETPDHAQLFKLYPGSEDQEPSTDLEAIHGAGNVPAYRGTAYVVMLNLDLGVTGRIPNFTFEVQQSTKDDTIPIDILVDPVGVAVLSTGSIFPNGIADVTSIKECNVDFIEDLVYAHTMDRSDITLVSSDTSFLDDGFVLYGTLTITGGANDGTTTTITGITGTVISVGIELTPESNATLTLHQPAVPALTTQGKVTRYSLESVIPLSTGKTGLNPVSFASLPTGGIVIVNGGDGIDEESTDALSIYVGGGLTAGDPVPLRTGGEISASTRVGASFIRPGIFGDFYIGLRYVPAITRYFLGDTTYSARYTLVAMPLDTVVNSTGAVFVLSANDTVYKLTAALGLTDTIPVGLSASHLLAAASDAKIWASHSGTTTVSHFTTSGNYATVTVGSGPGVLTEADDDYIWTAVGSSLVRIHHTAYTIQTFSIPAPITSLAPALSGQVWAASETGDTVYLVDTDGTYLSVRTPPGPTKVVSDADGNAYVLCAQGRTFLYIISDATIAVAEASPNGLACVVRRVSERCGLLPEEIDVSGLDNSPVNMVLTQIQSGLATLQQLIAIYSFIGVESDGILRYQFKTGASVATIPENALSGGSDKQDEKSLVTIRVQERELPTRVTVSYPDPLRNYGTGAQIIQLINSSVAESPFAVNTPLALSAERAKQAAEVILYEAWTSRESHSFTMTTQLLLLDPGDIVTLTARSLVHTLRLSEITDGVNWLRQCKSVSHRSTIYDDFNVTAGNAGLGNIHLPETARAVFLLIEIPPLSATDVILRYIAVPYSTQAGRDFVSGTVLNSPDAVTYTAESTSTAAATVGVITTALPNASPYVWDDTNTPIVRLYDTTKTLTSSTDLEVLAGANRFYLNGEICHFVTATLLLPGVYSLSRLLRGRNGTESFTSTHGASEVFVLITSNLRSQSSVTFDNNSIGVSESYKVTDPTTPLADAVAFTQTFSGNALKPWAPALQTPSRNLPASNDVTINWLHRSRLTDAVWTMGGDITYDFDDVGSYRIRFYSDSTYTTVMRTFTTTPFAAPSGLRTQAYTAAQQTTDYGSTQSLLYYGVSTIASMIGYEARGTV